jgi:hypothetical protein
MPDLRLISPLGDEYNDAILASSLTPAETLDLCQVTDRQMRGVQELLFRIMTSSYDFEKYRPLYGMDFNSAITEALSVMHHHQAKFAGNYAQLVYEYALTPLHIKILSRKSSVNILDCADKKNADMLLFRNAQRTYLRNRDISLAFHELLIRHYFSFEETIKILRQLSQQQIIDLKKNARDLDSCVGWVKDNLLQYSKFSEEESMSLITSMIINDKPLLPHHANMANVFRAQYYRLFRAENYTSIDGFQNLSEVTLPRRCDFLAERTATANLQPYESRMDSSCEKLIIPSAILFLGIAGCFYFLLNHSNPIKKLYNNTIGLFCRSKKKAEVTPEHPFHTSETDVSLHIKTSQST